MLTRKTVIIIKLNNAERNYQVRQFKGNPVNSLKTYVGALSEVNSIVSLALAREKPPKEDDNRMSKTLRLM